VTPWNTIQSPVGVVGSDTELAAAAVSAPEIQEMFYAYIQNKQSMFIEMAIG